MKIHPGALLMAIGLFAAPFTAMAQRYQVTNIGTLGGPYAYANAINASGQVTGDSTAPDGNTHAFLYTNGTMQDLGAFPTYTQTVGNSVNASGQVAGYAYGNQGAEHAFSYSQGSIVDLGVLSGDSNSVGTGINDDGQVVGYAYLGFGTNFQGFFDAHGVLGALDIFGGGSTEALGINASGEVTGQAVNKQGFADAFLYGAKSGTLDLGVLDERVPDSIGTAVNDSGQVTGASEVLENGLGTFHAFLYSNGRMQDLGTLPTGYPYSTGNAINGKGDVVGFSGVSPGRAILYSAGRMSDLNALISSADAARYTLTTASGINDRGQIVVNATVNGDPTRTKVALLLTPIASGAATTTTLRASPATAAYGSPITLAAVVKASAGTAIAQGTVTFKRGTVPLGTASLDVTGKASLPVSTLAAGEHSLSATYAGDSADAESTSHTIQVKIATVDTTTTLAATPSTAKPGTPIELIAIVKPISGTQVAHGMVTFSQGTLALGKANLDATGTAELSISTLAAGADAVTAIYDGGANDSTSTSKAVTVTIT